MSNVFEIKSLLNHPLQLVFHAFGDGKHLQQWWAPEGYDLQIQHLNFHKGGYFHYGMTATNGFKIYGRFDYTRIVDLQEIAFINYFADQEGSARRHPTSTHWPLKIQNRIQFSTEGSQTLVIVKATPLEPTKDELFVFDQEKNSIAEGFHETFRQLDSYLTSLMN